MREDQYVFNRVEKKYLLNAAQYQALRLGIMENGFQIDQFGDHTISNIYYDTPDFALIRHSLEKPVYKEKLRLRAYGLPRGDDIAFVEIKKKLKGVVGKRRVALPLDEAMRALKNGKMPDWCGQIGREIDWFLSFYGVFPKVMIAYDREAFFCDAAPDLRVTFDRSIRYRDTALNLSQGAAGTPLMPENMRLMEIKTTFSLPIWLCALLSQNNVRQTSFSKYGECYTRYLVFPAASKNEVKSSVIGPKVV